MYGMSLLHSQVDFGLSWPLACECFDVNLLVKPVFCQHPKMAQNRCYTTTSGQPFYHSGLEKSCDFYRGPHPGRRGHTDMKLTGICLPRMKTGEFSIGFCKKRSLKVWDLKKKIVLRCGI